MSDCAEQYRYKSQTLSALHNCARCGADHYNLEFEPMEHPVEDLTHWAMCPVKHEPILMKFVTVVAK